MTGFTRRIRPAVSAELAAARAAMCRGDAAMSFKHLERAHVLGQASTVLHVRVHWRMVVWGLRQRNLREILAQILRLLGAATKTPFGLIPIGNSGGSDVSAIRPMPIPQDLQRLIDIARDTARS